jgi:hypothetical protein
LGNEVGRFYICGGHRDYFNACAGLGQKV